MGMGLGLGVEDGDGVRARCRRMACVKHVSTQSARIARVPSVEVRQMRWPYLPRAR